MPSVAQESQEVDIRSSNPAPHGLSIFSRKRRWADSSRSNIATGNSDEVVTIFVHGGGHDQSLTAASAPTYNLNSPVSPSQRKLLPLGSKRLCLSNASGNTGCWPLSISASPSKVLCEAEPHHNQQYQQQTHVSLVSVTTPCHICHRKPRRKCDLDALAYCEGCGERTCFVCLRACPGLMDIEDPEGAAAASTSEPTEQPQPWSTTSHGHRRTVCSRCCIERGEEGDVVCLGCIAVAGE